MEFQGSSFLRSATSVQSNVENRPPQTAKLPPVRGASRRMACGAQASGRWGSEGRWAKVRQANRLHVGGVSCCRRFGTARMQGPRARLPAPTPSPGLTSMPPRKRCPLGLFFMPLSRCQMPPPTAPMPNAPPTSSRILQGQRRRGGQVRLPARGEPKQAAAALPPPAQLAGRAAPGRGAAPDATQMHGESDTGAALCPAKG